MPIYEFACAHERCPRHLEVHEEFFHSRDNVVPPVCMACANPMRRLASQFAVVFSGTITAKYNDRKKDNSHQEGHIAWRRKSAKDFDKPEPVRITTWQEQKRFCKEEGLALPSDMPSNVEISSDGKKLSSQGMPGSWV